MNDHLTILWTTGDKVTAQFMVLQYATSCITQDWWDSVEVVLWGASLKLAAADPDIQQRIRIAQHTGVTFSVCSAAARQLGVSGKLEEMSIPSKGWGSRLSKLLQETKPLLTV